MGRSEITAHPHEEWTKARIEGYVDQTEALRLEFKSYRALLWDDKKDRASVIEEAARDVAAMANEQGGVIVYGIEEGGGHDWRRAVRIEDGFGPQHTVSRDWFLQVIRDHVHPLLPELDAVRVPLDTDQDGRYALVILVPQSRGVARQTDDSLFWRRDAHGRHPMTVQEVEDIRNRAVRPSLNLRLVIEGCPQNDTGSKSAGLSVRFHIENHSPAAATFAVITIGLHGDTTAKWIREPEWTWIQTKDLWKGGRYVCASGSSKRWSPLTPGFSMVTEQFTIFFSYGQSEYFDPVLIGIVRLDHDGGPMLYGISFLHQGDDFRQWLRLHPISDREVADLLERTVLPEAFALFRTE